jgi:hypothetical protein
VTLVEVSARERQRTEPFLPLLAARNARTLATWTPSRIVPTAVPRATLAALAGAGAALVLVLIFAPRLRPPSPRLIYTDTPADDWPRGIAGLDAGAEHLLVAPTPAADDHRLETEAGHAGGEGPSDASIVVEARSFQQRIQDRLWGEGWDRTAGAEGGKETGAVASDQRAARAGRSGDADAGEAASDQDGAPSARPAKATGRAGRGEGASGAGTHTDPNLFGTTAVVQHTSDAAFRLALAARVRAERAERRPPEGEPPPAAVDARPALGDRQRAEAGVHRMTVPAGYETIVRELFTHRDAAP